MPGAGSIHPVTRFERASKPGGLSLGLVTFLSFVVVVAILRIAQAVTVPLALASLLAFLLSPLVFRLTRWGIGNALAVILATTTAFIVMAVVGWIISSQTMDLLGQLPQFEQNLDAKVAALKKPHAPAAFQEVAAMVGRLEREMAPAPEKIAPSAAGAAAAPVPVEVEPEDRSRLQLLWQVVSPVLGPMGTALIVMAFMITILLERKNLRDRLLGLVPPDQAARATQALNDATARVSRYLVMQLIVNAGYGLVVGLGLLAIGIPNALLWGLLSALLRFIPFVGPWIAAAFPMALALAIEPGWMKMVETLSLYCLAEALTANFIEVRFYGASTGISPLALMVAAVFWTWLWGAAGLFLCTPLTVCALVLGKYTPGLNFLDVLLSHEAEPPAGPRKPARPASGPVAAKAHVGPHRQAEHGPAGDELELGRHG
jgi:predicted PurR-regulated permease PerM